jgi:hypothetical protein
VVNPDINVSQPVGAGVSAYGLAGYSWLYASAFGFDLATVGLIFLCARLWDALIDPAIGIWSDRTRTRFGRRRPWIAAGGVVFAFGAVPVFVPPLWFGPWSLSAALFVLYLGYSMMATPFSAWGGELSSRYHERTRVATYQQSMTSLALLLTLILPSIINEHFATAPRVQLAAIMLRVRKTPCVGVGASGTSPSGTIAQHNIEQLRILACSAARCDGRRSRAMCRWRSMAEPAGPSSRSPKNDNTRSPRRRWSKGARRLAPCDNTRPIIEETPQVNQITTRRGGVAPIRVEF